MNRPLLPLLAALLLAAGPAAPPGDTGPADPSYGPPASVQPEGAVSKPEGAVVAVGTPLVLGGDTYPPPRLDVPLVNDHADTPDLVDLVHGTTVLFYFSATCPHCQAVAPELAALAGRRPDLQFIGIASGSNSLKEVEAFGAEYKLSFPLYKDYSRTFASANKARSTPTVWIVQPKGDGFETLMEHRPFAPGMSTLLELRVASARGEDPWAVFPRDRYLGGTVCGACHLQENASWGLTHHSVAWWTLYDRKEADDPACVRCHVTGFGQPTGFAIGDKNSSLSDVTCEACHGMGGPHGRERRPASQAREACTGCHDADHSIRFDVDRAVPHIDHWRALRTTPEQFRAARQALVEGKAPRPMLAFPEGADLGGAACQSCHRAQAAAWARSPHARALKTLKKRGSDHDPACLRCHAVKGSGEGAGAWLRGGVGCEACHGPGEQHVAAGGGTENIVGLGESCPECVIESICTSCHDAEQDPDWDLDGDLKKVRH